MLKTGQRVTYMQAFKIEGHQTLLMKQSEKKVGTDNDCKNDINSMILKQKLKKIYYPLFDRC